MSIGIDFGIGIDENSWYRPGIVSKPKKLVLPIPIARLFTKKFICSLPCKLQRISHCNFKINL